MIRVMESAVQLNRESSDFRIGASWIPAFAGMTIFLGNDDFASISSKMDPLNG